jgi:hypothetical protein
VHAETGKDAREYVHVEFRKTRPHWFPGQYSESDAELAFIRGNRTAAGRVLKDLGRHQAEALAKKYSTDLYSGKPGIHGQHRRKT